MKKIVAIEVSRDAVRAAEIMNPLSKNPKVSKIGEIELPPGVAGESQVVEIDTFVESVKELWANEKFSTKDVALVVSGRRFIIRPHETTHTDMKAFRSVMSYEVGSVVPEQMINPVIDFYPTKHIESKTGIRTLGLVIATPADPIETLIGALIRADLNVEFVDYAPMAIARFIRNFVKNDENLDTYALVNVRELSSDILIAEDNIPKMIRVAPTGLHPKSRKKGRRVRTEAEGLDSEVSGAEQSPLEKLADEINKTVASQNRELGLQIDKIYITGPRSDEATVADLRKLVDADIVPLSAGSALHNDNIDHNFSASDFVAVCAGMRGKK